MANETIGTSIDELAEIAIAEARLAQNQLTDLRNFVMRRTVPRGANSVRFPLYANQTAAALSDGSAVSNSELTTSGAVATPAVNAAWGTIVTDVAGHGAPQVFADVGRVAGKALLDKINSDIYALFDGFSTSVGTTNVDLTVATVKSGIKSLMDKGFRNPYLVVTPTVWSDLMEDAMTVSGNAGLVISDNMRDAISRGEVVPFYGAQLVVFNGVADDGNGDYKCALLDPQAIGYAEEWDVRVEVQRAAEYAGNRVVVTSSYAVVEANDSAGIEILADGD